MIPPQDMNPRIASTGDIGADWEQSGRAVAQPADHSRIGHVELGPCVKDSSSVHFVGSPIPCTGHGQGQTETDVGRFIHTELHLMGGTVGWLASEPAIGYGVH